MKIILIGFMGSGKSSTAKKLSALLQFPVIEMDELVFRKTNTKNMHEVFSKGGEPLLRETEIAVAKKCGSVDNVIISTGGGAVLNPEILENFKNTSGKIFFLKATFQTIAQRLAGDTLRPLFQTDAESLYHFRQPLYLKHADEVVEVDNRSVEEIAQEIVEHAMRQNGK